MHYVNDEHLSVLFCQKVRKPTQEPCDDLGVKKILQGSSHADLAAPLQTLSFRSFDVVLLVVFSIAGAIFTGWGC